MIYNLIWDVDGTMFDTYPAFTHAFSKALLQFGVSTPLNRINNLAKISLTHCVETLAREYNLDAAEFAGSFGENYARIPPQNQPPFPGVREVCRYIISVGGLNVIASHRQRESTRRLLEAHDMTDLVADVLGQPDGYPRKPDPSIFCALIERNQLDPSLTLSIGDRDLDTLAGKAAGLRTCLFRPSDLNQEPADWAVDCYARLLQQLVNENGSPSEGAPETL